MKSQSAREQQTVTIATALALFVAVLVGCGVVVLAAAEATGRDLGETGEPVVPWALGAAVLAAAAYLVRHRR